MLAGALAFVLVAVAVLVFAFLQGDLTEELGDLGGLGGFVTTVLNRYGVGAGLALLYIEESGVPLPVPGDAYVIYIGHAAIGSAPRLVLSWAAIVAVVTAGASNLFLISRRWGRRLLHGPLGPFLHLSPEALDRAEAWFGRWGILAIIFGRHIPGFRVPITVAAGALGVRYRVFAPGVAVSTGVWAALWLWIGVRFGTEAAHVFSRYPWVIVAVIAVVIGVAGFIVGRGVRESLRRTRETAG
ncbi:MAG: DedA family protein [Candidatus Dormibacteraeota bacterium]|nr:DedA family protein [Candidatus Dormibacteraeota bacterium]